MILDYALVTSYLRSGLLPDDTSHVRMHEWQTGYSAEASVANERLKADAALMMEALHEQMAGIAKIQRDRARLTATTTACEKRISVTVNGDGILIGTRFADDIADLTFDQIAAAMTEAVQAAAQQVNARARALMEPLRERKSQLPRLSDLIEDAPDFAAMIPVPPPVSVAPPNSPERRYDDEQPGFADAEPHGGRRSMVSDHDD
ncbi:YbaB/EbfC family nucleoid-associated protein [Nocardia sp. NPDC051570]|uniref:YbaB/EbfC family nucleoid-associated protein n=1 Tax=Nocardia sp. NPDC051570 TaxID=3364324 RepID=UPI0037AC24E7